MKITAPESFEEYLEKTEHAVRHFYVGLESCWSYYEKALEHWDVSQLGRPMTPELKEALDKYLKLAGKYFHLKFSEAMFAGGILQIAHMGIRLYSQNDSIPECCTSLVARSHTKAIPFCVGQIRHGLPVGLIVYAARNQYNHWDDDKPHKISKAVFDALSVAFRDDQWHDLAFSLGNPTINVYANEVLLVALGWRTYDKYLAEMKSLLSSATDSPAA